uniref:Uncharacterized protein n=1 Tax=Trypanosoma vivax (strain Y486) TaxID=1055687 RepID=G0TVW6_TRYVY|nr:conserved hypothetical protein [Trypanosoma vivax Y486]
MGICTAAALKDEMQLEVCQRPCCEKEESLVSITRRALALGHKELVQGKINDLVDRITLLSESIIEMTSTVLQKDGGGSPRHVDPISGSLRGSSGRSDGSNFQLGRGQGGAARRRPLSVGCLGGRHMSPSPQNVTRVASRAGENWAKRCTPAASSKLFSQDRQSSRTLRVHSPDPNPSNMSFFSIGKQWRNSRELSKSENKRLTTPSRCLSIASDFAFSPFKWAIEKCPTEAEELSEDQMHAVLRLLADSGRSKQVYYESIHIHTCATSERPTGEDSDDFMNCANSNTTKNDSICLGSYSSFAYVHPLSEDGAVEAREGQLDCTPVSPSLRSSGNLALDGRTRVVSVSPNKEDPLNGRQSVMLHSGSVGARHSTNGRATPSKTVKYKIVAGHNEGVGPHTGRSNEGRSIYSTAVRWQPTLHLPDVLCNNGGKKGRLVRRMRTTDKRSESPTNLSCTQISVAAQSPDAFVFCSMSSAYKVFVTTPPTVFVTDSRAGGAPTIYLGTTQEGSERSCSEGAHARTSCRPVIALGAAEPSPP